jgi:adenylate cyclase
MRALALIGRNIVALNTVLVGEGAEPVRFGIGVHAGAAVVGEVGYGESRVFTTLGDAANVAARLEAMCKEFGCEAVVSQAVLPRSGHPAVGFGEHEISVRGRDARLVVYTIAALEGLAGVAPSPGEAGAGRGAHGRTHADREEP